LWDEKKKKLLVKYEMVEPIHSLRLNSSCMLFIVGSENSVHCCSILEGLQHTISTGLNPRGIQAVSHGKEFCIATPATQPGVIQITWLSE
jgi:hypothetical protein